MLGAKLAGSLGGLSDGRKRWRVALVGLIVQGGFFACQSMDLPGVSLVTVQVVCMLGLGLGMGLVDGSCPALLAESSEARHGGTGVVYTLSTAATQLGFLIGPVGGSAVMAGASFGSMCLLLGAVMWGFAPLVPAVYRRAGAAEGSGGAGKLGGSEEEKEDLLAKGQQQHESAVD